MRKTKLRTHMLCYLAGFFDGEGCVGIYPHRNARTGKHYYELSLNVTQKDRTILNFFQAHYGGYIIYNHKQNVHKWTTDVPSAVIFLNDILPFLIVKSAQVKLALEFQKTKSLRAGRRDESARILEEAQSILCKEMKRPKW